MRAVRGELQWLGGAQDNKEDQDRMNRAIAETRQVCAAASSPLWHAWPRCICGRTFFQRDMAPKYRLQIPYNEV